MTTELNRGFNGKEMETLQALGRFNVLIHPLFRSGPAIGDAEHIQRFELARAGMSENILKELSPQTRDEVTLFMPLVLESLRVCL